MHMALQQQQQQHSSADSNKRCCSAVHCMHNCMSLQFLLLMCVPMSDATVLRRPKKLKEGKAHPDPVVETLSLAAVDPPPVTYQHALQVRWVLLWTT